MLRAENVGKIKQQTVANLSFTRPNVNLLDCGIDPECCRSVSGRQAASL
jgi:hypothetical protein